MRLAVKVLARHLPTAFVKILSEYKVLSMTIMASKSLPLKTSLLSIALSSLVLTLMPVAQAAVTLDESTMVSSASTATNCNANYENNATNNTVKNNSFINRFFKSNNSQRSSKNNNSNYASARQQAIACMQLQLKAYQLASMSARQQYFAYKAQAWLNYANHEDSIKSTTAAGDYAFNDAEMILQALQSGSEANLNLVNDIPETSALMRPDLWANVSALKDSGGVVNAPRELAFSEVGLVWAAADHCEHGWRSSSSHFRMADRWLEQAREAFVNANDSAASVAMQDLAVSYFKQYESLDPSDDVCRGQVLSSSTQLPMALSIVNAATINSVDVASTIPSTKPSVSYKIAN